MSNRLQNVQSEGPLSGRIRRDLESKIFSGHWPIGHRIPSEMELAHAYGCSRMTVNKVIVKFVSMGLLERNRRAGTVVCKPTYQSAVSQLIDIGREVASRGNTYSYQWLKQSVNQSERRLTIECLHFSNKTPVAYEIRMINLKTVPAAETVDFASLAPGRWLIDNVPWSEAENEVSAVNADNDLAKHLQVKTGIACLLVERDTWSQDNHLTNVRQYFRGDAYHLVSRFGPSG